MAQENKIIFIFIILGLGTIQLIAHSADGTSGPATIDDDGVDENEVKALTMSANMAKATNEIDPSSEDGKSLPPAEHPRPSPPHHHHHHKRHRTHHHHHHHHPHHYCRGMPQFLMNLERQERFGFFQILSNGNGTKAEIRRELREWAQEHGVEVTRKFKQHSNSSF